jgi:serine/threonine protein kinase
MADLTGKAVGPYRIVELIGQGPAAEVYRAYQADLDRHVAIKVFPGRSAAEAEPSLARFEQEVRAVATLRHPHIISLLDFGSEDGVPYVVMEYLPGTSLKARLNELALRRADMPWNEASRIGEAVAKALAHAHQRGIIHRNVKPANVLLTTQGDIVLTDFALAALTKPVGDPVTMPAYLAPEQCRGEPGDSRSDIYALGVLLYEMATGRLPFEADTPLAMLEKHLNEPVPLPGRVKLGVPLAVEQVILKALAKNPADRYQQGADIAGELADAFRAAEKLWSEKPPDEMLHVKDEPHQRKRPWLKLW